MSFRAVGILFLSFIFWAGCSLDQQDDPGADTSDSGISSALLVFPSSLSAGTSSKSVKTASTGILEELNGLYSPVRDFYNPLAETAIGFVKEVLSDVETNILDNDALLAELDANGSWSALNDEGTESYAVTLVAGLYTLTIDDTTVAPVRRNLYLEFTQTGDEYDGFVIARDAEHSVLYRADFNTNDPELGSVTELYAIDLDNSDPAVSPNEIDRLWLKAWQIGNDFYVNANIRYLRADIEPEAATHSFFYDYVMGQLEGSGGAWSGTPLFNGNYVYRCVAKTDSDIGAVSLSLVPEDDISTDNAVLFDDYSIGQIYENAVCDWFTATDGDYTDSTIVADMNNSGFAMSSIYNSQHDGSAITATGLTNAEVFLYLSDYRNFLAAAGADNAVAAIDSIIFVTDLTNPGYFDSTGFQGTASNNTPTPTWAAELPAEAGTIAFSAADMATAAFSSKFDQM